jgi:hypothetical protein
MQASGMTCPNCGHPAPTGTRYCAQCGDPLDVGLLAEVRALYAALGALDSAIAAGQGDKTVSQLREEYLTRYLSIRTGPASQPAPERVLPSITVPVEQPSITVPVELPAGPAPRIEMTAPAAAVERPAAPAQPPRPVFSWQAFLGEQAIAIMSYLGGFLLLVATITFEVGGWQVLPGSAKLAVVTAVYVVFGGLGLAQRRSARLVTVGGTYLGVFALMTPLVALAAYRFSLQASGFSIAGMTCISALYATVVYLALGLRLHFMVYSYLGWVALVVGLLAIIPWSGAPIEWSYFVLATSALILQVPRWLRRLDGAEQLGRAAAHVAAVASFPAVCGVELLLLSEFINSIIDTGNTYSPFAVTAAAVMLVPLAAGWRWTLHRRSLPASDAVVTTIEVLGATFAAQAGFSIALGLGATLRDLAFVLAALSLAELGGALALYRLRPQKRTLRRWVEALALTLAGVGVLLALPAPASNLPLAATLTAGMLTSTAIAFTESAPWWLLASGFFLTFDYQSIASVLLPPSNLAQDSSSAYTVLTLAICLLALATTSGQRTKPLAAPLFVVALGDALYTSLLLVYQSNPVYQTAVLLIFAVAAFIAAERLQQPRLGTLPVALFGILATLPFVLNDSNGWHSSLLALLLLVVGMVVRRRLGRTTGTLAPYVVALVAAVLAVVHAGASGVTTSGLELAGVPWPACLALILGALAAIPSFWEPWPWTMSIPAVFTLWAIVLLGDRAAGVVLVFVIAGAAVAARQWRGRWWGTALDVAALLGSFVVVINTSQLGSAAPNRQVALLLAYGLVAYLVAVHEREPRLSCVAVFYALAAVSLLPGPANLVPTLALMLGLAAVGVALRLATRGPTGGSWRLAPYAAAVGASAFAVVRVVPFDAGRVEALLLVLAGLAYAIVYLEGVAAAAILPAIYAGVAALLQPDAHALLPLALGLSLGGLLVGRAAGIRWSYPFYVAGAVAAGASAVLGVSQSHFEALALLTLAVTAYAIAVIESRPDLLPLPLTLLVLALAVGSGVLGLSKWGAMLAFAALGWVYALGALLWPIMPGLRSNGPIWWTDILPDPEGKKRWSDPRFTGAQVHNAAALLVAGGTLLAALAAPDAFTPHAAQTEVASAALLSFAGLLVLFSRVWSFRLALYAAGGLAALTVSWELRWLGADNIQAFILVPGSYLILVGGLLPADQKVARGGARIAEAAALIGAALLLVPTLVQSLQAEPSWVYALILAIEALLVGGAGVGIHARALVLIGSAFVVLAALRGAILAVQSGLPIPVVIAVLAVLLMGGATWLSLSRRREAATRP